MLGMDLKEIEYFLTIERERSLVKAAEKLFISQPAVSKFLSKLESSYGSAFFYRNRKHLELTKTGQIYLEGANAIMSIARSTDQKIEDEKTNGNYSISVGLTGERSQRYFGKILSDVYEVYPHLHCVAVEAPVNELQKKLKDGELDFAFYAISDYNPDLTEISILNDDIVIAIPQNHRMFPIAGKRADGNLSKVDIAELKNDPFVLLRKGTATRAIIDKYLKEEKVVLNEAIVTKGNYSNMLFVDNGLVCGFCFSHYNFKSDRIRYLGLKRPLCAHISIAYRKGAYLSLPMVKFLEAAKARGDEY